MNILNLPSPTAGASLGEAVGAGLGALAQAKLGQFQRNQALKYLDANVAPTENLPDTTYNAPKLYTQREKEQLIANAPLLLRNQVANTIEQRNAAAMQERALASSFGEIGDRTLTSVYPNATPDQRTKFRNRMLNYYQQGLSEEQAALRVAKDAKEIADSASSVEQSIESLRKQPMKKFGNFIGGKFVPTESLVKTLKQQVQPLVASGEIDLARKLLKPLDLTAASIESIIGQDLSPLALKAIQDSKYETVKNDLDQMIPKDQTQLKSSLLNVFKADPNANLVLLRKQYETANKADWNSFRDAVVELANERQINLTPDQRNQLAVLKMPEYDLAEKVLETVSLENNLWEKIKKTLAEPGPTRQEGTYQLQRLR